MTSRGSRNGAMPRAGRNSGLDLSRRTASLILILVQLTFLRLRVLSRFLYGLAVFDFLRPHSVRCRGGWLCCRGRRTLRVRGLTASRAPGVTQLTASRAPGVTQLTASRAPGVTQLTASRAPGVTNLTGSPAPGVTDLTAFRAVRFIHLII